MAVLAQLVGAQGSSLGEGIDKVGESIAGDNDAGEERRSAAEGTDVEEVRQPRAPLVPGRPTKREIEDHSVCHWPFRSWCRHCVRGRAQGSPHRSRSELDREHSRLGHPTISLDHCFLGSAGDETALGSLFLVLVDNALEATYAVACSEKGCKPWIVEYVYSTIYESGYSGLPISMKCDAAPELKEIRRKVAAKGTTATVPIDVPVGESKGNGAVEKGVKTWQGQFRTIKDHLDHGIGFEVPKDHLVLQWLAWWSASVLNRVAVRSHGRTVFEHTVGHCMKTLFFLLDNRSCIEPKDTLGHFNKYDSEWTDGIFLGRIWIGSQCIGWSIEWNLQNN